MNKPITPNEDGSFQILSSDGVNYYKNVRRDFCECAGFIFRKTCRHIKTVNDYLQNTTKDVVLLKDNYYITELIDLIGADQFEELRRSGKIIVGNGKVYVL